MSVTRISGPVLSSHEGLYTMEQRFLFTPARAERLAERLWTMPLIGPRSLFGKQTRARVEETGDARTVHDFSPVPGFQFDVILGRLEERVFSVRFAQPGRSTPYLSGGYVWLLSDEGEGALLDEQINTPRAREYVTEPLAGPRRSLRTWLFFRVGHARVMDKLMGNLAAWGPE